MNKRDLIAAIAEDTGTDKKTADQFLTSFVDVVTENVREGGAHRHQRVRQVRSRRTARPVWVGTPRLASRSRSRRRARSG